MSQIYLNLGRNETGQLLVGCPHVPIWNTINMYQFPDGSATYDCRLYGERVFFKPSQQTIVIWCAECWRQLGEMERHSAVVRHEANRGRN